ncbi:hypothetical protein [Advenella mimigardefordensis]|uniref:hypothetical protein n=1 Tax=Advenella mimigardefordensis TaxID=302406 RepID=UPI00046CB7FE|nr:hypothetical protein [Advenella mimigardefordensis]
MVGMVFLFALIAAVLYYFLDKAGIRFRVLISVGTFLALCGVFALVMLNIGDQAAPNSIIITPEVLEQAARHRTD